MGLKMENDNKRLFVDLDGVLADFEGYYTTLFGEGCRDRDDSYMWKRIASQKEFFFELPPITGALEFFSIISICNPIILTACPSSNYESVADQKHRWVRKWLGPEPMVLPVVGGKNKCRFLQNPGDILIDDHKKNLEPWTAIGGTSILFEGNFLQAICDIYKGLKK